MISRYGLFQRVSSMLRIRIGSGSMRTVAEDTPKSHVGLNPITKYTMSRIAQLALPSGWSGTGNTPPQRTSQSESQEVCTSSQSDLFCWSYTYLRQHPFKTTGIVALLVGRYLFATLFLYGCYHKSTRGWLWTDRLKQHFLQRLTEIDPHSFQAAYLRHFAIPLYRPIGWIITVSQSAIGMSLVLGVAVRPHAILAAFLLLNFAAGAYYNASLPPLIIFAILLALLPSGQWLGIDHYLHRKYPDAIWFR